MNKTWSIREISPKENEHDIALNEAVQAASDGSRVLLCVPDTGTQAALRLLWDHSRLRLEVLPEPQGFLCRKRLEEVVARCEGLPLEEREAAIPLVAWAAQTASSRIAECRGFYPERHRVLWSRVCCDTYAEDPGALSARNEAEKADVVLTTQSALFAHLRLDGALLPACDTVIFVSAHTLVDAARKAFGREVMFFGLRNILQLSRRAKEEPWVELEKMLQRFFQKAGKQAVKLRQQNESRIRYSQPLSLAFGADPAPLIAALKECEDLAVGSDLRRVADRLRVFRMDFENLCEARDAGQVYWLEEFTNPHKAALRSMPLDLSESFGSNLQALFEGGLFLSPAVALPNGGGKFFLSFLGMDTSISLHRTPDAHPSRFLLAPFVPAGATTESAQAFSRFLFEAAAPFLEHGLVVLFPHLGALRSVYRELGTLLPPHVPLWAQHVDGNRETLTKLFASARGGFILATEGMEGLRDCEGKPPALVIATRMPLPSPREPLWEALGEQVRAHGGNLRFALSHPAAVLKLKRELAPFRKDGLKTIWLLDARASSEGLGAYAAKALDCEAVVAPDLNALQVLTRETFG